MIVRAFLRFHLFRLFFDESRFHASSCPTEARSRSKPRDGVHPSSLVSTELDLLYAFFTRERLSSQSHPQSGPFLLSQVSGNKAVLLTL